ncbi:MAG TPA: hypothetical protein VLI69_04485 [Gammaproteobacteria bacterium]|nr:hypothetical protein [Gammaproteobacteria bacterium]
MKKIFLTFIVLLLSSTAFAQATVFNIRYAKKHTDTNEQILVHYQDPTGIAMFTASISSSSWTGVDMNADLGKNPNFTFDLINIDPVTKRIKPKMTVFIHDVANQHKLTVYSAQEGAGKYSFLLDGYQQCTLQNAGDECSIPASQSLNIEVE